MVFEMKLNTEPFERIKSGRKKLELRLFDEKRQRLDIGDIIIFSRLPDMEDKLAVKVMGLCRFATFTDLFATISPDMCGIDVDTIEKKTALMRKYYSEEEEKKYGVLGIKVELIDIETALKKDHIIQAEYEHFFPDGVK